MSRADARPGLAQARSAFERRKPMTRTPRAALTLFALAAGAASPCFAQGRPDLPSGEKHNITQTERIGPFLDGADVAREWSDPAEVSRAARSSSAGKHFTGRPCPDP
jgi:hypothetical protein